MLNLQNLNSQIAQATEYPKYFKRIWVRPNLKTQINPIFGKG